MTAATRAQNGGTLWPREVAQEGSFKGHSLFEGTDRVTQARLETHLRDHLLMARRMRVSQEGLTSRGEEAEVVVVVAYHYQVYAWRPSDLERLGLKSRSHRGPRPIMPGSD